MDNLQKQFGPYLLLKHLATGGMADIYVAKTVGFGGFEKFLALKMILPKYSEDLHFIKMLVEEAKIAVQLNHNNIAQVFDLGRIGETYYIAMEYVEGADIFKIMKKITQIGLEMPIDTCLYICHEICRGLDYAHKRKDPLGKPLNIIHRDISPQNVLVSFAGEVKIVDFGIAKATMRAQETQAGVVKGKYYYMSPEQAWGDPLDQRTDIFSAGIILYEMLVGQMLYLEDNIEILIDRIRKAHIQNPSTKRKEIPKELDRIVMKALKKFPEERYQTAEEFGNTILDYLHKTYPGYTSSRLSGLMAWVFEEELEKSRESAIQGAKRQPSKQLPLLEREEYKKYGTQTSVIFNLADFLKQPDGDEEVKPVEQSNTIDTFSGNNIDTFKTALNEIPIETLPNSITSKNKKKIFNELNDEPLFVIPDTVHDSVQAPNLQYNTQNSQDNIQNSQYNPPKPPPIPHALKSNGVQKNNNLPQMNSPISFPVNNKPSPAIQDISPTPIPLNIPQNKLNKSMANYSEGNSMDNWVTSEISALEGMENIKYYTMSRLTINVKRFVGKYKKIFLLFSILILISVSLILLILNLMPKPITTGDLEVVSVPPDVEIYINGKLIGYKTPLTIPSLLQKQMYKLEIKSPGYLEWAQDIFLDTEKVQQIAVLTPIRGILHISSNPNGARVYVNDIYKGNSPLDIPDLELNQKISIQARMEGFPSQTKYVEWSGNKEINLNFNFKQP